jgi:hypothetical protein
MYRFQGSTLYEIASNAVRVLRDLSARETTGNPHNGNETEARPPRQAYSKNRIRTFHTLTALRALTVHA